MKKDLRDFVKELTKQDKKTLLQMVAKLTEETGELAGAALPFEDACGTIHRFSDKQKVLEEVADTILVALSIAYKLNATDEDIDEMMSIKSKKWATIQQNEARVNNKIPFELHVTVKETEKEKFFNDCKILDVKPIVLALQCDDSIIKDVMTSSIHVGSNRTAYEELQRISGELTKMGYEVVREKIETVPWHPAAPSIHNMNPMPKDCYFETHIGVHLDPDSNLDLLKEIAKDHDSHLSKNAFKIHADGSYMQMITLRLYIGCYEDFEMKAAKLEENITKYFSIEKRTTEFSIYDTKVTHDSVWLLGTGKIEDKI